MTEGFKFNNMLRVILTCLCIVCFMPTEAQNTMKVKVSVKGENGKPVAKAAIVRDGYFLQYTNEDGKAIITVAPNTEVKIISPEYEDMVFNVGDRQDIELTLVPKLHQIEEVTVVSTAQLKKVAFEPTDIELRGNYLHVKTRFKIPTIKFNSDTRLILQLIMKDVKANKEEYMRPLVTQGSRYTIARERAFSFKIENDPLNEFRVDSVITPEHNVITYNDSVYVHDNHDDYMVRALLVIEDYSQVIFRDSIVIAKGTLNSLRFFDYKIEPMTLTGSEYIPKPEMGFFQDKGETKIAFKLGSSKIDYTDPENVKELKKISTRLSRIVADSMATLRSITMSGYSSPDGAYERNLKLAHGRTAAILSEIKNILGAKFNNNIKLTSTSYVDSWANLAVLMENDGLTAEASSIRAVLKKHPKDPAWQIKLIKRLPFYRTKAVEYLEKQRRVQYEVDYTEFRVMSDQEIWQQYEVNSSKLSRYDYYRLIETADNDQDRIKLLREVLTKYPAFLLAANQLAVATINQNIVDKTILEPFIKQNPPAPVIVNQIRMLLQDKDYLEAKRLASMLPDNDPQYAYCKGVTEALSGNFAAALPVFSQYGGLNEVLLLLSLKENKMAYEKVLKLDESNPKVMYIRAVCANRLENLTDAMYSLGIAFQLDPTLIDIARLDSDATDLLELVIVKDVEHDAK